MGHEILRYEKVGDVYFCIAVSKDLVAVILFGHSLTIWGRK